MAELLRITLSERNDKMRIVWHLVPPPVSREGGRPASVVELCKRRWNSQNINEGLDILAEEMKGGAEWESLKRGLRCRADPSLDLETIPRSRAPQREPQATPMYGVIAPEKLVGVVIKRR